MKKIAIIGGGIIGQFCAHYLNKSGHEVTIYDDNPEMPNASYGNCGLITPSHILPMNSWATILQGIKWLGIKDAPLSIKPQFNRRFIGWFLDFMRHANGNKIKKSSDYRHELLQLTWKLYQDFFQHENPDVEFFENGLMYVCKSLKSLKHVQHEHELLKSYQLRSRLLTGNEISQIEPTVKSNLGGAIFECDGWLDPVKLNDVVQEINKSNGVNMINSEVRLEEFTQEDMVVLAAGAKSAMLAREYGIPLRLIPGKGYNLTSSVPLDNQPKWPIYMFDKKVVFTPWPDGFRIGSTMEFSGYDLTLNEARLKALKTATEEYLEIDITNSEFTPWSGWRPMTSDTLPIIQKSKKRPNLILATGHGMLGLSLAPATGYLVDCLVNEKTHSLYTSHNY